MKTLICLSFMFFGFCYAQIPSELNIDSSYAFIQGYSGTSLQKLKAHFDGVDTNKVVILHYGGSHIQAENPTTIARTKFQDTFGNGGRGLLFSYGAANTYSSINYSSTYTGNWSYNKSYQGKKLELPLGICGMVVETTDTIATLSFGMKKAISATKNKITILYERDDRTMELEVKVNDSTIRALNFVPQGASFIWMDSIRSIQLIAKKNHHAQRFRFYGINVEDEANQGVIYHSTGVGAAAFRSILILEKLPEQLPLINPDIVILDFGTNDILYENRVEASLANEVEKAISWWKSMVPEVMIVLTSTQDLFYKKHPITAGVLFRDLMDSLARKNDCLFWNWYDLSGGLNTIRTWASLGYAKNDHIHLTKIGYQVKGGLLYTSFINTLNRLNSEPNIKELYIPLKDYKAITSASISPKPTPPKSSTFYVVKSGDTLSEIASKHHTTVAAIKRTNGLSSDTIRIGQRLKIP
ncbi:MAG: LysM peptidoglycan-binding domain-containing protein [Flavobacteriales bacterium]